MKYYFPHKKIFFIITLVIICIFIFIYLFPESIGEGDNINKEKENEYTKSNTLTNKIYTISPLNKNTTVESIIKRMKSLPHRYHLKIEHIIRTPIGNFNYTYNTIRLPIGYRVNSYYDIYSKVLSFLRKMGVEPESVYLRIGLSRYSYSTSFSNSSTVDYLWSIVVCMEQNMSSAGDLFISIIASTGTISTVAIDQNFINYINDHKEIIVNTTAYNMVFNVPIFYSFNDIVKYVKYIEYLLDINKSLYGDYYYEPPYYGLEYPINTSSIANIELYQVYKGHYILPQYVYSRGLPGRIGIVFKHGRVYMIFNCLFPLNLYKLYMRNYVITYEEAQDIAVNYVKNITGINEDVFNVNATYKVIYWMDNNVVSNYWCVSIFFNIGRGYKALVIIDPISGEVHDTILTPLVISYR